MAWNILGDWLSSCSCKSTCPCNLGPAEPDQGWCSAVAVLDIHRGSSDGVNLGGSQVVVALDLPGDFIGGIDAAKLYISESASDEQRRELEAIIHGKKGGVWEAIGTMIKEWRPSEVLEIDIERGDNPTITVGSVGRVNLQPIKTEDGQQTRLINSPLLAEFGISSLDLARGDGTSWSDPIMRQWESLGHGEMTSFDWSG